MPVSKGPASSAASQKQQSSISSFFAPKSSPIAKKELITPPSQPSSAASQNHASSSTFPTQTHSERRSDDSLFVPQGEDRDDDKSEEEVISSLSRRVLKRHINEDESGNVKRQRIGSEEDGHRREALAERSEPNGISAGALPGRKKNTQSSERTSKYLFGSTQVDEEDHDEEVIRQKIILHERFVKKLGRPDSLAEIRRRNHILEDNVPEEGEDNDEEESGDEAPAPSTKGKKAPAKKLTPMVQQVIDIKRKNMDTLLVVEVGYKFRFYGEDARIAAKELSIVCIPGKFRFDDRECSPVSLEDN